MLTAEQVLHFKMPLSNSDATKFNSKRLRRFALSLSVVISHLIVALQTDNIITHGDWEHIQNSNTTTNNMMIHLWEILRARLDSTDQLIDALGHHDDTKKFGHKMKALMQRNVEDLNSASPSDSEYVSPCSAVQEIKIAYEEEFRSFKPLPFDPDLVFNLEDYWVNLQLEFSEVHPDQNCLTTMNRAFGSRVVICKGEPGAGKTTFCKYLCYQWARGGWDTFELILYAQLRDVLPCETIIDLTLQWMNDFGFCDDVQLIKDIIKQKRTLVILDGYDEATEICGQLTKLLRADHYKLQFHLLLTSRPWAIEKMPCRYAAQIVTIGPLGLEQQKDYATKIIEDDGKVEKLMEKVGTRRHASWRDEAFYELSRNILLFSYICFHYATSSVQSVFTTVTELYVMLFASIIDRCETKANPEGEWDWETSAQIRNLGKMALFGFREPTDVFEQLAFSYGDLEKFGVNEEYCTTAGLLVKDCQRRRGKSTLVRYNFPHKTAQEFLVSKFLLDAYKNTNVQVLDCSNFGYLHGAAQNPELKDYFQNTTGTPWIIQSLFMNGQSYIHEAWKLSDLVVPNSVAHAILLMDSCKPGEPATPGNFYPSYPWGIGTDEFCPQLIQLHYNMVGNPKCEAVLSKLTDHVHIMIESVLLNREVQTIHNGSHLGFFLKLCLVFNFPMQRVESTELVYFPSLDALTYCSDINLDTLESVEAKSLPDDIGIMLLFNKQIQSGVEWLSDNPDLEIESIDCIQQRQLVPMGQYEIIFRDILGQTAKPVQTTRQKKTKSLHIHLARCYNMSYVPLFSPWSKTLSLVSLWGTCSRLGYAEDDIERTMDAFPHLDCLELDGKFHKPDVDILISKLHERRTGRLRQI